MEGAAGRHAAETAATKNDGMIRFSAGSAANLAAWAVFGVLICAAVVAVAVLGFVGLLILGGATWLICTMAELNHDAPTWGTDVFKARMGGAGSPEQRAAMHDERRAFLSPVRFYRNCGIFLALVGAAGVGWQIWRA